jgi:pimeloyl-ACP methyl ester carboxylesterase
MRRTSFWHPLPLIAAAVLLFAGCTGIATVKVSDPRPAVATQEPELSSDEQLVREANKLVKSDPNRALGNYLAAAHGAFDRLKQHPNDESARSFYNYCVARSMQTIEQAGLMPWQSALKVPGPDGEYTLTTRKWADSYRNPADYELIPSDTLSLGGTYFQQRVVVPGVGAPLVAAGRETRKDYQAKYTTKRIYGNTTAVIQFKGHEAEIQFWQPFERDKVTVADHSYPLAADFTAPVAVGLTRERPEKLGLIRMLRPDKFADTAHLARLQMYDPNRIPVIFVHGLQDTPASWTPMVNALYADPEIRRRYQFWVFSYPSGYPYPYAAALFRQQLDGVDKVFPNHKQIVLVGHSMGGLLSRLMVTDVGDKMWIDIFGKPPAQTNITGPSRKLLEESLIFNHRKDVSRVIFICAPHRGADMATNIIGRIASKLIAMPFIMASIPLRVIQSAEVSDPGAPHMRRIPNSIDTLSPENRFVKAIDKFPIYPGIPFHTIEGDRGRGDAPNSSDGIVPYWSSHLKGAKSELIVPSNHSAPSNSMAIEEVKRILHLHK